MDKYFSLKNLEGKTRKCEGVLNCREEKRRSASLKQVQSGRVPFPSKRASSNALKGCAALPLSFSLIEAHACAQKCDFKPNRRK
jgi:hypothetical protein